MLKTVQGIVVNKIPNRCLGRQDMAQMIDPVGQSFADGQGLIVHRLARKMSGDLRHTAGNQFDQGCRPNAQNQNPATQNARRSELGAGHIIDLHRRAGETQTPDHPQTKDGGDQHAQTHNQYPTTPAPNL